ncbi:DNA helicase HerA-like ATPase [Halorubrum alkaliphilum]|uniref:DNA helicase HerA-like ATPase n=1 Tax=Halorubrum alkaliphilum TaxID=261290 RepID=A0A8T4GAJ6_9EURY|nr:ATP-binding protein [Halorubrum alkaliphilum]MBP1921458.1 DNA helicase HerA-like ATPase [Halorubrum alkaliphilum]
MTLEDFTEFTGDDDAEAAGDTGATGDAGAIDGSADGGSVVESDGDDSTADRDGDRNSNSDRDADEFAAYDVEPAGEDAGLGVVSVSQGLRVAEEADETAVKAFVTTGNREAVRIGKYLVVPYPDGERLFCRITALEYAQEFQSDDATEIHARRQMRRDDFTERDYKFMAELDPMSVVYDDADGMSRRMTDRVPKPGAVVEEAADDAEIKTGLKIPEEGVFLGHLSVGGETVRTAATPPTVDYRIKDDYGDGDPLAFRHTLVAGGTGSGKTHASKNVLRQYLDADRTYPMDDGREARMAVVQFDPQDEYAQMHDDNPEMDDGFARKLDREGIAHGGHDDTVALVPESDGATYPGEGHRAERMEFTIPFSMVNEYDMPWLIAGSGLNDNQYSGLLTLLNRFFGDYGSSGTYRQFLSYLDDPALKEELDESGRVHEATFDAVKRRVRGVPGGVFDGDATPITELDHTLVRPGGLSVVPTYHLPSSRQKEIVVLAVSTMLVGDKLSNDPRSDRVKETPLLIGMDEAHNFLADADNVQARKVVDTFTEAAKQGRKERLGLFLITQDPQDVAESVFKQVNTKVVLNLGDEDAIKSVNIPSNLAGKVPYMEKGQMVVYSPDNSEPVELIGLPTCVTRHGD